MEDIEKVSVALNLTLAEIIEVETPNISVVNMDENPTCSKYLIPSFCSASGKHVVVTENSSDDEQLGLDDEQKSGGEKGKKGVDELKKRKKDESETKKQEKKRSHKKKKGGEKSNVKPNKDGGKDVDDEEAEENSSDEDVNQLNQIDNQTSEFKSIKDLPVKQMHKVLKFEIVETVNGRTVRLQLEDKTVDEGFFFVHLPRRFLPSVEANFLKYSKIVESKKPFYFAFMGQKGRTFKVLFTRNPDKAV